MLEIRKLKKKAIIVGLSSAMIFGSFVPTLPFYSTAEASTELQKGKVTTGLNFRTAPSLDSNKHGVLPTGSVVEIIEKTNQYWYKVEAYERTGYVSTRFVDLIEAEEITPESGQAKTTDRLNFRKQPSLESDKHGVLPTGAVLDVLEQVNQYWVKVEAYDRIGYVSTRFIEYIESSEGDSEPEEPTYRTAETTTGLNFRKEPSLDSSLYGVLPKGSSINVIEQVNQYWVKVEAYERIGYVSTRFIKYTDQEAPAQPEPEQPETPAPDENDNDHDTETGWEAKADQVIQTGLSYEGTPYRFGAKKGSGYFDCSLFTQTIFAEHGYSLPRNSRQQYRAVETVSNSELRKGDLVFFYLDNPNRIDHVAIYMGDDQLLHALTKGVDTTGLESNSYWSKRVMGVGRVIE